MKKIRFGYRSAPAKAVSLPAMGGGKVKASAFSTDPALIALKNYDWQRALRVGYQLAEDNKRPDEKILDRDIWWELLREASSTSRRAYTAPPHTGWPGRSSMPESPDEVTGWQLLTAYVQGQIDEADATIQAAPPEPSAAQVSRAEMVLEVWHRAALSGRWDWRRKRLAVYLKAMGVKDRVVRAKTGLTRQAIHAAKIEALQDMSAFLDGLFAGQG